MPDRAERRASASNARKFLKKTAHVKPVTTIVHGNVDESEIEDIRLVYGGHAAVVDWDGEKLQPVSVHFCALPPKESLLELQAKHHMTLRIVAADIAREMVKIDKENQNGS